MSKITMPPGVPSGVPNGPGHPGRGGEPSASPAPSQIPPNKLPPVNLPDPLMPDVFPSHPQPLTGPHPGKKPLKY